MSESTEKSFPNKAVREKCNKARDAYFKCLDDNDEKESACSSLRKIFEQDCPAIWVSLI